MPNAVLRVEAGSAVNCEPRSLTLDELAGVHGGMRWQDFRPSENVEDRRGLPRHKHPRSRPLPPLVLPPRYPGDLPSQAGLDDLEDLSRRMKRRRRRR